MEGAVGMLPLEGCQGVRAKKRLGGRDGKKKMRRVGRGRVGEEEGKGKGEGCKAKWGKSRSKAEEQKTGEEGK
eukprot:767262-Hanusia_phi.AAC.7